VRIHERNGERIVVVRDNGTGFEEPDGTAGQGLKNMRQRAASIGGAFRIVSKPGRGTALEITLRA
jgi:signal transduction histidine kinase